MVKIIKYLSQAIIIYLFFIIIKILGLKYARNFFSYLFKRIGPLIKSEKIVNDNLNKFSGSYNEDNNKKIKLKMWSNYGKIFVEYLFLKKFRNNSSHIKIKGEDILEKIIKNGKPVIFVSGHFANFELMSMELTKKKN
jgi:KDO2-lipid IV(A) lauroyltransferase